MKNIISFPPSKHQHDSLPKQLDRYLEYPELRSGCVPIEQKSQSKKQMLASLLPQSNLSRSPVDMNAIWFRRLINLWPPYWGTGISVSHVSTDFKQITVTMKLRWYNKNAVGKHFGGSLFSMTDPFHMLMIMKNLGSGYMVMDKAGGIDFLKPGKGTVTAEFLLTEKMLDQIKEKTASGDKFFQDFTAVIRDEQGEEVARVTKTVYIRKKSPG
jgi:acyl-coenzyme A thioesterase PaaI-like protein